MGKALFKRHFFLSRFGTQCGPIKKYCTTFCTCYCSAMAGKLSSMRPLQPGPSGYVAAIKSGASGLAERTLKMPFGPLTVHVSGYLGEIALLLGKNRRCVVKYVSQKWRQTRAAAAGVLQRTPVSNRGPSIWNGNKCIVGVMHVRAREKPFVCVCACVCVCVCVRSCANVCVCVCEHTHMHTYISIHIHMHAQICIHKSICKFTCAHTYAHVRIYIYIHKYRQEKKTLFLLRLHTSFRTPTMGTPESPWIPCVYTHAADSAGSLSKYRGTERYINDFAEMANLPPNPRLLHFPHFLEK